MVLALGGQPPTGGAHSSPASLYPLSAGPSCSSRSGPLLPSPSPRGAGWPEEGGRAGECWGRRFGSAVSG